MKVIGITGPTGAGKTTVLQALRELGGEIVDCDALYHDLTENSAPMRRELAERFGKEIFGPGGELLRKELGAVVFDDPKALADLNAITHRYVHEGVEAAIAQADEAGKPAVAVDAIALLESGLGRLCHATVAVTADAETRARRIMARDGIDREYARMRIRAQKPAEYFERQCDYVLRNDGEAPEKLKAQAVALFQKIID